MPEEQELKEIVASVNRNGICLLYSTVLEDYIAFVKDESYLKDVPPGYTPYLDSELRMLFGGTTTPSTRTLRLIHEAKKRAGGRVISREEKPHEQAEPVDAQAL
jgi:hypothetical protein